MDDALPETCRGESGRVAPVVDRNRCEGKEDCVVACPFEVFAIGTLGAEEKQQLSFLGRLKAWAHGNRQAFVVKPDSCYACGLCLKACPEQALTLKTI